MIKLDWSGSVKMVRSGDRTATPLDGTKPPWIPERSFRKTRGHAPDTTCLNFPRDSLSRPAAAALLAADNQKFSKISQFGLQMNGKTAPGAA